MFSSALSPTQGRALAVRENPSSLEGGQVRALTGVQQVLRENETLGTALRLRGARKRCQFSWDPLGLGDGTEPHPRLQRPYCSEGQTVCIPFLAASSPSVHLAPMFPTGFYTRSFPAFPRRPIGRLHGHGPESSAGHQQPRAGPTNGGQPSKDLRVNPG